MAPRKIKPQPDLKLTKNDAEYLRTLGVLESTRLLAKMREAGTTKGFIPTNPTKPRSTNGKVS